MSKIKIMSTVLGLSLCLTGIAHGSLYNEYTLTGNVTSAFNVANIANGDNTISILIDAYSNTSADSFKIYLNNSNTPYTSIASGDLANYTTSFNTDGTSKLNFTYASSSEAINVIYPLINPYGTFDIKFSPAFSSLNVQLNSLTTVVKNDNGTNLSPTPIPAAACLFGSGLMGLVGLKRKNRTL